jgi:tRNA (guanine6-N2)-methyltransferase
MEFYATVPPGIEDIASEEIEGLGGKITDVRKNRGRIFFKGDKNLIPKVNFFSRCVERVVMLLDTGKFRELDEIHSCIKKLDFKFLDGKSFAIRSLRVGEHTFTSMDIARVAGQAVIDSFMEAYGRRLKVDLTRPDVIIRVDVVIDEFFVGVDTTGDDALHKRWWRVYNHPAHLNSAIACAMIRLSEWNRRKNMVDPMCGSGTIPIEAAMIGRNIPAGKNREFAYFKLLGKIIPNFHENKNKMELHGVEKFKKHLDGAIRNAESAGVIDTVDFRQGDATKLDGIYDCIITNPPYGLRIASKRMIKNLYEKFIKRMQFCMHDESALVIITAEDRILKRAVENAGLNIMHERFLKYGGLATRVFIIGK